MIKICLEIPFDTIFDISVYPLPNTTDVLWSPYLFHSLFYNQQCYEDPWQMTVALKFDTEN